MVSLADHLDQFSAHTPAETSTPVKNDDDTKRTTPLCEEDETSVCLSCADEDSEISSLGGMEDGFDIHESIRDLEDAAEAAAIEEEDDDSTSSSNPNDDDEEEEEDATQKRGEEKATRPVTPELPSLPTTNSKPSFNAFLQDRANTLGNNMDYIQGQVLRRVGSAESIRGEDNKTIATPQEDDRDQSISRMSFVEERASTFSKNLQFIASGGLLGEGLPIDEEEEGKEEEHTFGSFFQARVQTFARNIETITSVLKN